MENISEGNVHVFRKAVIVQKWWQTTSFQYIYSITSQMRSSLPNWSVCSVDLLSNEKHWTLWIKTVPCENVIWSLAIQNFLTSVCALKLKCTWAMQQDNDPKHISKSTSEQLKTIKTTIKWKFWCVLVKVWTWIRSLCTQTCHSFLKSFPRFYDYITLESVVGQNSLKMTGKSHRQLL